MVNLDQKDISQDYFFKKKVLVTQRKKGYRFSVDAPLLADFLPTIPNGTALEIGTGCGIISMLALFKRKFVKIYAVEIQDSLARLADINGEKNGFSQQFQVINGDFNDLYEDFRNVKIDTIFSNPPYFPINRGRLSPNPEIRDAKAETKLNLSQLLKKSRSLMGGKRSLCLILPFDRHNELLRLANDYNLFVQNIRKIFSFKDGKPERFLVQLTNYSVSPNEMKPLIIFQEKGIYSDEMDKILTG
ncbi:MAG: methyltransferase [bacterium]|nr:methyltransferase [bacterium]